jgi:hypothetical protein
VTRTKDKRARGEGGRGAPDWNVSAPPGPHVRDWLIAAGPPALVGSVLTGTASFALSPLAGLGVGVLFPLILAAHVEITARSALRLVSAVKVLPGDRPRLGNLVTGLASELEIDRPALWLIPEGGPNAIVCGVLGKPAVAVTTSLLDGYTRSELEAVVAHCLVRTPLRRRWRASLAVALGRGGWRITTPVGYDDDVRAAALTRYPPALADAIAKAEPRRDRLGPLWFVAEGASHRPQGERGDALLEL